MLSMLIVEDILVKDHEEFPKINLETAAECAKQLRLRDMVD